MLNWVPNPNPNPIPIPNPNPKPNPNPNPDPTPTPIPTPLSLSLSPVQVDLPSEGDFIDALVLKAKPNARKKLRCVVLNGCDT